MGRTRRAAIDGGFALSGSDWSYSGSFYSFGGQPYAEFSLGFTMQLGGNGTSVSTVTLWSVGLLSLGSPTQAQIDFMASGASPIPGAGNAGFPGEFFVFDYEGFAHSFYSFGIGYADYNAPFSYNDEVNAAFFTFEDGYQIVLDQYGFSILTENGSSTATNGYFIGGKEFQTVGSEVNSDYYPDFFTYTGTANPDTIQGSDFNDRFISSAGADVIDGKGGFDIVSYANSPFGVTVNLATGGNTGSYAAGDQLINIVDLEGSSKADRLVGNDLANRLFGLAGKDIIRGGDGDDLIEGGADGDDLDGGSGDDKLSYRDSPAGVTVSLEDSTATGGSATGDVIKNFETVYGSDFDDTLVGSSVSNVLTGESGDDVLVGLGGADFLSGGFGDDFLDGGEGADFIDGGGGFDTVSYAGSAAAVTIDLYNGTASGGDAEGDTLINIRAAVGSAFGDTMTAYYYDSRLDGGGGADVLTGRFGADVLLGGDDDDMLDGGPGSDTLSGGTGNDTLLGRAGTDSLSGDDGNDILDGGTGADVMDGGAGDDTYEVDSVSDIIRERIGGGHDIVRVRVSYTLAPGVEVEELATASNAGTTPINLTGNEFDNEILGNAGNNILKGGAGNDVLKGAGGTDRMIGGTGNDTYYVDSADDVVQEGAGEGTDDRVVSRVSYTLASGVQVERLSTFNEAATTAMNLTGNQFANTITGNAGTNVLDGGDGDDVLFGLTGADTLKGGAGNDTLNGGPGTDTLIGGTGNDIYYVDSAGDVIQEAAGEGATDRVLASVSYVLAAGVQVELLSTTNDAGLGAINLTGNEFENAITGNAGSNILKGGDGNDTLDGGAGNDTLIGGLGNDTFYVDSAADVIQEGAAEGTGDRLLASVSYTLANGVYVEKLQTTDDAAPAAINLTGNDFNNALIGNAGGNVLTGNGGNDNISGGEGNDTLNGGIGNDTLIGGGGNDTLVGGAGNDFFRFSSPLGADNVDTIADYVAANDTIQLDRTVFAGLAAGSLASGAFTTGTAAADADDRIIYDPATGQLWFDADGNAPGAAVHFATLSPGLALNAGEFVVI